MAESEDGGSLLGSSRKSLADTSVTSTADLSIFSGGQDGHTTNNTNNNNSIHSNPLFDQDDPIEGHALVEEDEQSSPGSAYCSMSIATTPRPPSAMRITPTPRNVSPQDIVRIYVPPPPPEELLYDRPSDLRLNAALSSESGKSPESDCRTIIQRTPTELPGSVSTATITSHSVQRFRGREEGESLDRTLRDLALYSSQGSLRGGGDAHSTSSSRRGSMSRKSTMLVDPELAPECPHIRIDSRKNSLLSQHRNSFGEVNSDGTSSVVVHGEYEAIMARANKERPKKPPRIMTSFEKLAQLNDTFYFGGAKGRGGAGGGNGEDENEEGEKVIKKARQKSDDEGFSYSFQAMRGGGDEGGKSRTKSDYNIQYKARGEVETLSAGGGGGGNGETVMKNKKQYDRFFTPDESEEDDEDEEEGNMSNNKVGGDEKRGNKKGPPHHLHHLHHHHQRRTEGNSSSSPSSSSKSLLTTPVNERQPLIMTEDDQGEMHRHHLVKEYKFKHSVGGGNKRRVKHLTTDEDEDGYDDEEEEEDDHLYSGLESKETPLSSPTEVAVKGKGGGGAYYAHRASSYIPIMQEEEEEDPGEQLRMTKSTTEHSMGRISIRINEKKQ